MGYSPNAIQNIWNSVADYLGTSVVEAELDTRKHYNGNFIKCIKETKTFSESSAYAINDYCIHNDGTANHYYKAKQAIAAGTWDATKWDEKTQADWVADCWQTITIESQFSQYNAKFVIGNYDSSKTYNRMDRVFYDEKLYRCLSTNVTGTWDDSKWASVMIMEEVDCCYPIYTEEDLLYVFSLSSKPKNVIRLMADITIHGMMSVAEFCEVDLNSHMLTWDLYKAGETFSVWAGGGTIFRNGTLKLKASGSMTATSTDFHLMNNFTFINVVLVADNSAINNFTNAVTISMFANCTVSDCYFNTTSNNDIGAANATTIYIFRNVVSMNNLNSSSTFLTDSTTVTSDKTFVFCSGKGTASARISNCVINFTQGFPKSFLLFTDCFLTSNQIYIEPTSATTSLSDLKITQYCNNYNNAICLLVYNYNKDINSIYGCYCPAFNISCVGNIIQMYFAYNNGTIGTVYGINSIGKISANTVFAILGGAIVQYMYNICGNDVNNNTVYYTTSNGIYMISDVIAGIATLNDGTPCNISNNFIEFTDSPIACSKTLTQAYYTDVCGIKAVANNENMITDNNIMYDSWQAPDSSYMFDHEKFTFIDAGYSYDTSSTVASHICGNRLCLNDYTTNSTSNIYMIGINNLSLSANQAKVNDNILYQQSITKKYTTTTYPLGYTTTIYPEPPAEMHNVIKNTITGNMYPARASIYLYWDSSTYHFTFSVDNEHCVIDNLKGAINTVAKGKTITITPNSKHVLDVGMQFVACASDASGGTYNETYVKNGIFKKNYEGITTQTDLFNPAGNKSFTEHWINGSAMTHTFSGDYNYYTICYADYSGQHFTLEQMKEMFTITLA